MLCKAVFFLFYALPFLIWPILLWRPTNTHICVFTYVCLFYLLLVLYVLLTGECWIYCRQLKSLPDFWSGLVFILNLVFFACILFGCPCQRCPSSVRFFNCLLCGGPSSVYWTVLIGKCWDIYLCTHIN